MMGKTIELTEDQIVKPWRIPIIIRLSAILLAGYFTVLAVLTGYEWSLHRIEQAKHDFVQRIIASELSGPVIVELDKKGQLVVKDGADLNLAETRKALVYYKLKSESLHAGIGQLADTLAMVMDVDNDDER